MSEGVSASMSLVLRMVGEAIGLDSQNRRKEAYCQYLSCCIYISQILKDDAWDKDLRTVYNKDVAKMYKLIQQCQERALNIISSESPTPLNSPPGSPSFPRSQQSQTLTPPLGNVRKHSDPLPTRPGLGHTRSPSDPSNSCLSSTPPQYRGRPLKLPSPPSSPQIIKTPGQSIGNLSKPQTDRRITGLNLRISRESINKNLSTMRKMSENMLIAKAREEAIRKKVWERQQRLQVEANRRFASAVAASKEEQEQRLLYTKILEYEQDVVWPKQLRERLKHSPEDTALINNIINKIFSSKDHPLKQFLLQYQYYIYKKLLPLLKDVEFPNERQAKDTKDGLKRESESDQVDSGPSTASNELERKNTSDGIESKDTVECKDLESENHNAEFLKDEEKKIDIGDDGRIDTNTSNETSNNDVDSENTIPNKCDNDKKMTKSDRNQDLDETGQDDILNMDNDISEKRRSSSDEIQEKGHLEDATVIGERRDNCNLEESCTENKDMDGDILNDENINSIIHSILENMITQIVKDESVGDSEMAHFEPKPLDDDDDDTKGNSAKESIITQIIQDESVRNSEMAHLEPKPLDDDDNDDDTEVNSAKESTHKSGLNNKTRLMKIESFDLESEFLSLEDDMFESESSDEENDERPDTMEHSGNSLSHDTSVPCTESGADSVVEMQNKAEENNDKGEAQEKEDEKEEKPDLKDIPEKAANGSGENTSGSDGNKDVSSVVDLEETRKQLNEIFVDMRFFLEKLKGFIILAYEELATPTGHDQCYAAVEYPFFQPLWPLLLGVLRRVNFDKEISLGSVMTKRIHSTPADMRVVDRLCLSDKDCLEATGNTYPYQLAVEQLHKVSTCCCPLEKIECIVRASRGICQCVEDYWECKGKPRHSPETSIGCDDLLPIFGYVIIKSGMAQLISETIAMEEFIPEGYLMGEEGYCLTTLQTALAYLVTLDSS